MKTHAATLLGMLFVTSAATAQEPPTSAPARESAAEVTPHHPDEVARLREEWTPPGEEPQASGSGDARGFLGQYLSTKPFEEVWMHYAAKLGMPAAPGAEPHYQPNLYTQLFPRMGPRVSDGHATLTIKNIQFQDQQEYAATLIRHEPNGTTITICLASQGKKTVVFVGIMPLK